MCQQEQQSFLVRLSVVLQASMCSGAMTAQWTTTTTTTNYHLCFFPSLVHFGLLFVCCRLCPVFVYKQADIQVHVQLVSSLRLREGTREDTSLAVVVHSALVILSLSSVTFRQQLGGIDKSDASVVAHCSLPFSH